MKIFFEILCFITLFLNIFTFEIKGIAMPIDIIHLDLFILVFYVFLRQIGDLK